MPSIRHQINIAAGQKAVWRALTTAEGLMSWWADEARVDSTVGGRVIVISEGDDGEPVEEVGIFHTLRPVRIIEIHWDSTSPAQTKGTRVQFQLARDKGETRVVMTHAGGGVLEDEEARSQLDKDWRLALKGLQSALES